MVNKQNNTKRCSVDRCDSQHKSRGFCNAHYRRVLRHGQPEFPVRFCSVEGCSEAHYGLGLCRLHHLRQWRGTPLDAPIRGTGDRTCSIDGCGAPKRKGGMCASHYDKQYRAHPEYRSKANARSRERYATDSEYRGRKRAANDRRYGQHSGPQGFRKRIPTIFGRQGAICPLCDEWLGGDLLNGRMIHIDHIVPRSKGGSDDLDNLQLTHATCNLRKSNKINLG